MGCGASKSAKQQGVVPERQTENTNNHVPTNQQQEEKEEEEIVVVQEIQERVVREVNRLDLQHVVGAELTESSFGDGQFTANRPYTERNIKIIANRIQLPTLVYYFDFFRAMFHYFNPETGFWKNCDIAIAENDCPKNPLLFFKAESGKREQAEEHLSNTSLVLTDDNKVYIIGGHHPMYSNLEFDIIENRFTQKAKMLKNSNNPNLCYMDRFIYCMSGDIIDDYSNRFDRYDIVKNEWTELPALPQPHGFGCALCIVGNSNVVNSNGTRSAVKVIVVGGFMQKLPRRPNVNISIFDFQTMQWSQISIEDMNPRVPRFIRSPLVQDDQGKIHILGAEGTGDCYIVDIDAKTMQKNGRLARGDDPEKAGFCNDAVLYEEQIFFIFKREDLRQSRGLLRLHKGLVNGGNWEVI